MYLRFYTFNNKKYLILVSLSITISPLLCFYIVQFKLYLLSYRNNYVNGTIYSP